MRLKLLLLILLPHSNAVNDPLEKIVSNFVLTVRSMGEKWLSTVMIPRLDDINNNPNIAYNVDEKTANALSSFGNFLNTCPIYLPVEELSGQWHVLYSSRRLLETTLNDIHQVIDRLSSSKPLQSRNSLDSLFRSSLQLECPSISLLDGPQPRFEWSYSIKGERRSIIGDIHRNGDRSLILSFAPTLEILMAATWTSSDSLVLSQVDAWPPCDNHLLLTRDPLFNTTLLRERLTLQGANLPSNPLISIPCPSPSPLPQQSIISPSSNPSQPQPWFEKNNDNPWSSQTGMPYSPDTLNSIVQDSSIPSIVPVNQRRSRILPLSQLDQQFNSQWRIPAQLTFNQVGRGSVQVIDPFV